VSYGWITRGATANAVFSTNRVEFCSAQLEVSDVSSRCYAAVIHHTVPLSAHGVVTSEQVLLSYIFLCVSITFYLAVC
jgi:hypothetical protein